MKNCIDARVEFSFKGETYAPSATIDLDALMNESGSLPDLHRILARENGIDTYSYLYEVMESHEISFSNANGLAADCMTADSFDGPAFVRLWREDHELALLQPIARRHLDIDDLGQHPQLKEALLEAYRAGKGTAEQAPTSAGLR